MLMTVVKMVMLVKVAVWLQQEGVPVEQVEEHCPALPSLENLVPCCVNMELPRGAVIVGAIINVSQGL